MLKTQVKKKYFTQVSDINNMNSVYIVNRPGTNQIDMNSKYKMNSIYK